MKTLELKIDGMTCHHCAMAVKKELGKISDIKINNVTLGSAIVEVDESKTTVEVLKNAVTEAGYVVTAIN